ncbi:MAG: hypothetical protein U0L92_06180 [Clostridia bacterium]|nr:hypothetical protein [Clostridia bacterium]
MYRRYAPNPNPRQNPNSGQSQNQNPHPAPRPPAAPQTRNNPNRKPQPSGGQQKPMLNRKGSPGQKAHPEAPPPKHLHTNGSSPKPQEKKKLKLPQNPILGLIPTSVYNPETKKVLGMFSAEDLLLAGLIFLLLENEENEDPMLVYALLYILISDYIDLPF